MKLIIASIILYFLAANANGDENKPLRDWYREGLNKINTMKPDDEFYQYTRNLNLRCISHSIGYNSYPEKELNFTDSTILIYGSGLKCFDEAKQQRVWKLLSDKLIDYFFSELDSNDLTCYKMELKRQDPNSKYVSNFNEQSMTINTEDCEETVDMFGVDLLLNIAESVFGDLSKLTRGVLDNDKFKRILLALVVLKDDFNGGHELINELKYALDAAIELVNNKLTSQSDTY